MSAAAYRVHVENKPKAKQDRTFWKTFSRMVNSGPKLRVTGFRTKLH